MAYEDMEILELFDEFETKLDKCVSNLKYEFSSLKAGRANAHILDKITADYYGTETPINQMANISIPEARLLVISPWDASCVKNIEKAIIAANIGINPNSDGKVIRLIFPELTEERRRDLVKQIKATSENCKVVLRNARRDINDSLKKMKKDATISEDDCALYEKDVDKKLAEQIAIVDKVTQEKEKEVMSVWFY